MKRLISALFLFLNTFFALNQVKLDVKKDGITIQQELKLLKLYELIVTDIKQAESEIKKLESEIEISQNKNYKIEIAALESELYRSQGDFTHMKLAFYEAVSWKDSKTNIYQNTLLKLLRALNEGTKKNKINQEKLLLETNQIAKQNNFKFIEAKSDLSLGKFYSNESNYKKAKPYFDQAKLIFNEIGLKNLFFEANVAQGISFFWEGNYAEALKIFHENREYSSRMNLKKSYANALLNLGEAHLFIEGHSDSAKYYFNQFLNHKKEADVRDLYHCYYNLEEYFNLKNNIDSAYYYSKLMVQVDNQLKSKMLYHTNQEIDLLYKKLQDQKKIENESNHQSNLKTIFGLSGIFLTFVVFIFIFILKDKSRINKVLTLQNEDINSKNSLINQSLKEKEILLKEIHHRVKNNLQIISSLLSLQSKNIDDPKAKIAIIESKERIQAIALIHKKLYLDNTYATIEMSNYLSDLVNQIRISYLEKSDKINILVKTNELVFNIDTVVPLGLIICELLTNAFKYAFEEKIEGKIKIEISKLEEGFYQLAVKDNGSGTIENFSFLESKTFGAEIITALTEQLEGEISFKSSENGTSIKIKFREINT